MQHDPLKFRDQRKYPDRLKDNRAKTGKPDAVTVAHGPLDGTEVIVAVQDFAFMGGSLGMAAGEAIVRGAEEALARRCPNLCRREPDVRRYRQGDALVQGCGRHGVDDGQPEPDPYRGRRP